MEVLNSQPMWGHSYQCIHYFGCKRAVNSAIFHLCCTFIQGQLVKRKKNNMYPTETCFTEAVGKKKKNNIHPTETCFNSVYISKHN